MKKLHFITKFIVSFVIAILAMAVCIGYDASDNLAIAVFFGVGVLMMLGLGALDGKGEESKFDTIRHKIGRRNYGHAAVFIGTACLFMGTPKECEELCDDLWHHGQQVHMDMLDGEETLEIL